MSLCLRRSKKLGAPIWWPASSVLGKRAPLRGFCGTGRWIGVPQKTVWDRAGVFSGGARVRLLRRRQGNLKRWSSARSKYSVKAAVLDAACRATRRGRLSRFARLRAQPRAAYCAQGFSLRLIVRAVRRPEREVGSRDPALEDQYLGKFQARWHCTPQGRDDRWRRRSGSDRHHTHAAEVVHRACDVRWQPPPDHGIVLNDGTPIKYVESDASSMERIAGRDDGSVHDAEVFAEAVLCAWNGATPGPHTLISGVTDVTGKGVATADDCRTRSCSGWTTRRAAEGTI